MTNPLASATVEIEMPFHDIDVMGIAWHGHYAKYLEIARCAMLDTIGYNVPQMRASGYAWPVIEMNIRYAAPLHFQQKIQVQAVLVEVENRMKINYRIFDLETGKRLTKAHTIQVAVSMESGEMQFASPRALLDKLSA
ncbi:MAG: acyl-CoA thioesterase [Halieaceae bacterium]|jgi:acyl-CoA thioester hydrolase|nr:acyl-CoA thioesterase [Halieaceae bacterium]